MNAFSVSTLREKLSAMITNSKLKGKWKAFTPEGILLIMNPKRKFKKNGLIKNRSPK